MCAVVDLVEQRKNYAILSNFIAGSTSRQVQKGRSFGKNVLFERKSLFGVPGRGSLDPRPTNIFRPFNSTAIGTIRYPIARWSELLFVFERQWGRPILRYKYRKRPFPEINLAKTWFELYMELTGVPGRRKLRRKNSQNRNPLAAATVDNVRPLRRATYNRALGLADYSNDAFNAV